MSTFIKFAIFLIFVKVNRTTANYNFSEIYRTPHKDMSKVNFDHFEIIERSNFDDDDDINEENNHCTTSTQTPVGLSSKQQPSIQKNSDKNFANAQVLLKFPNDNNNNRKIRNLFDHTNDVHCNSFHNHNFFYPPTFSVKSPPSSPSCFCHSQFYYPSLNHPSFYHPYPPPVPFIFPNYYYSNYGEGASSNNSGGSEDSVHTLQLQQVKNEKISSEKRDNTVIIANQEIVNQKLPDNSMFTTTNFKDKKNQVDEDEINKKIDEILEENKNISKRSTTTNPPPPLINSKDKKHIQVIKPRIKRSLAVLPKNEYLQQLKDSFPEVSHIQKRHIEQNDEINYIFWTRNLTNYCSYCGKWIKPSRKNCRWQKNKIIKYRKEEEEKILYEEIENSNSHFKILKEESIASTITEDNQSTLD